MSRSRRAARKLPISTRISQAICSVFSWILEFVTSACAVLLNKPLQHQPKSWALRATWALLGRLSGLHVSVPKLKAELGMQVNQIEDDTATENGLEDVDVEDEHGNLSTVKRKRIVFGKLK